MKKEDKIILVLAQKILIKNNFCPSISIGSAIEGISEDEFISKYLKNEMEAMYSGR